MTPKRRRIISKNLIDLFDARAQEYQAIVNERAETITQYDTGDDLVQRELHREIAETMNFALNEIEMLKNYTITRTSYYYKLLEFSNINIGNKIWNMEEVVRNDNPLIWGIMPNFLINGVLRPKDVIVNTPELYSNIVFNCSDNKAGVDEPFTSTITPSGMCVPDATEIGDPRNFERLYEAFSDLRSIYINAGSFRAMGVDFWNDNWLPYDMWGDAGWKPTIVTNGFNKRTVTYRRESSVSMPYDDLAELFPASNTYVACANRDLSVIKICKIYEKIEDSENIIEEHGNTYAYIFSMVNRLITDFTAADEIFIYRRIGAADAYRIFDELKATYLTQLNTIKALLATKTENYAMEYELTSAVDTFISDINALGSLSVVSNVEAFFTLATAFNSLLTSRANVLYSVITHEDNRDDIRELLILRAGKNSGTLFDVFRRMEGIDPMIARYWKGSRRIDFLKKKLITTKIIQQPDNEYEVIVEKQLNSNYNTGQKLSVGDTVYVIDEINPELQAKILSLRYGFIDDVDGNNISENDPTTSVKKTEVMIIELNKIVSNVFDKDETLRIVKEL